MNGMEALEGFVIGLYSELFNAVISLINRYLLMFSHVFQYMITNTYYSVWTIFLKLNPVIFFTTEHFLPITERYRHCLYLIHLASKILQPVVERRGQVLRIYVTTMHRSAFNYYFTKLYLQHSRIYIHRYIINGMFPFL